MVKKNIEPFLGLVQKKLLFSDSEKIIFFRVDKFFCSGHNKRRPFICTVGLDQRVITLFRFCCVEFDAEYRARSFCWITVCVCVYPVGWRWQFMGCSKVVRLLGRFESDDFPWKKAKGTFSHPTGYWVYSLVVLCGKISVNTVAPSENAKKLWVATKVRSIFGTRPTDDDYHRVELQIFFFLFLTHKLL